MACADDDGTPRQRRTADRALLVGPSPIAVAAGEGGVFVVDGRERSLRRFDAQPLRRQGAPVRLAGEPVDVAAGSGSVWIALRRRPALVRVDPASGGQTGRVTLPGEPVAVDVGRRAVWVATRGPDALVRVDPRTGRTAGRPLGLPFEPSDVSARDLAVWVAGETARRIARVDPRTGALRRSFRPPLGPSSVAAGDDGSAWFAEGDEELPYGHVPVEGDYLELDTDTEQQGSLDVAVGPRGAVYVLTGTDSASENSGGSSYTTTFRTVLRIDPRTGDPAGDTRVGDDARALAAGEGAAWVVQRATGDVPSGSWRLQRAVP